MAFLVTPTLTSFVGADIARTVQDVDVNNPDGYNFIFSVQFNQAHAAVRNRLFMEL